MINAPAAWDGDKLNRKLDAKHLREVLFQRYKARRESGVGSYILNIDAPWGEGKTYFLKNLCLDLRAEGHAVAYVNAWQDDHADQPMTTVIAAIDAQLAPFLKKDSKAQDVFNKAKGAAGIVAAEATKQILYHAIKVTTGVGVEKIIKTVSESQQLDTEAYDAGADEVLKRAEESMKEQITAHHAANEAIHIFRERVSETLKNIDEEDVKPPFFVFVDELDRCRPLYAIRMLEDMKHLFQIDGVVFVIATDTTQLSNSVCAIYGERFDGGRYLRRFFDRVYVFPESDKIDFIDNAFSREGINIAETFFSTMGFSPIRIISKWVSAFQLSNRDFEQVLDIVSTFVTSWNYKVKIEPVYFFANVGAFLKDPHYSVGTLRHLDDWTRWILERDVPGGFHSPDQKITLKTKDVFENAVSYSDTPFIKVNMENERLGGYLLHENQARFSGGGPLNDASCSVLSQYFERVKNAGRHLNIDRQ